MTFGSLLCFFANLIFVLLTKLAVWIFGRKFVSCGVVCMKQSLFSLERVRVYCRVLHDAHDLISGVVLGMDQKFRHFRKFEPSEGHAVMSVQWSRTGDRFLVCPGSAKAKIYDRDGYAIAETIKGDMYIRDMTHTFVRVLRRAAPV